MHGTGRTRDLERVELDDRVVPHAVGSIRAALCEQQRAQQRLLHLALEHDLWVRTAPIGRAVDVVVVVVDVRTHWTRIPMRPKELPSSCRECHARQCDARQQVTLRELEPLLLVVVESRAGRADRLPIKLHRRCARCAHRIRRLRARRSGFRRTAWRRIMHA
jgi:hypothetical protein